MQQDERYQCKDCKQIFDKRGRFGRCPSCSGDMEPAFANLPTDESTGRLYTVKEMGNPEVRQIVGDEEYPNRYVMIFRDFAFVDVLTCPHCGKRAVTNSHVIGKFDNFCTQQHNGKKCRSLTTYVFERRVEATPFY